MSLLSALNLRPPKKSIAAVDQTSAVRTETAPARPGPRTAMPAPGAPLRSSGNAGQTNTPGGDAPSDFPGLSKDDLRNAYELQQRQKKNPPAGPPPSPQLPIVFEPKARVLTAINTDATPNVIREGEELTVDLFIENWDDEAPDALTASWAVDGRGGSAVTAKVVADAGAPSRAYLSLTGKKAGAVSVVVVRLTLAMPGGTPKTSTFTTCLFSCTAAVPADPDVEHARAPDGGGIVSQTDLDQDLTNLLQDWMQAASTGISQFATGSLESKINALSEPNMRAFLFSLLGNTLWALTVFNLGAKTLVKLGSNAAKVVAAGGQDRPQQAVSFVISMVGIAVPAVDSILNAGAGANTIDGVRQAMDAANQRWYQHMQVILLGKIKGLGDKLGQTPRYAVTNQICEAMFKPGTVKIDAKGTLKPTINMNVVTNRYRAIATTLLARYEEDASKGLLERSFDKDDRERIKKNQEPIGKR